MRNHLNADWDTLPRGTFAEGQADPARYARDSRVGRFSDGQAEPTADLVVGRYSEGLEGLAGADVTNLVGRTLGDDELAA